MIIYLKTANYKKLLYHAKNKYIFDSENHIIKLKSEIGEVFEENIKNTLNFEFGWEKGDIREHFYYRIAKLDEDEYVLMRDDKLAFNINGKKYFFISKSDNISLKGGKALLKRYDNNGAKKINEIISKKIDNPKRNRDEDRWLF